MLDVEVIERAEAAQLALDPIRSRILAALTTPESAASLALRLDLPRQKVNYHLRVLEEQKLVVPVEERQWGGLTERMMAASARSYVVSPSALGPLAADPDKTGDRLSAAYLIALASRVVREVGALWKRARANDQRLATLSLDVDIAFRSPRERAQFTERLAKSVAELAADYHAPSTPGARPHRLVVVSYPALGRIPTGVGAPGGARSGLGEGPRTNSLRTGRGSASDPRGQLGRIPTGVGADRKS